MGPPGSASPEPASEAITRLARRGYGRRFEDRGGRLWCPSCEITFHAHDLVIDQAVPVSIGVHEAGSGIVYALRCASCGASGTWLVQDPDPAQLQLIKELREDGPDETVEGPPPPA